MAPVLGYWKIRGLAQAIRLLLEYTGEEYTERLYVSGNAPDYSRDDWLKEKDELGLDFPNLPYWIDGDFKLTQSQTILRYIAEKHGLIGKTIEERAIINMLGDQVQDLRMGFARTCYNPNFADIKDDYLKHLPESLKTFSSFLGTKSWLAGEQISYPDFHLYDVLDSLKVLSSTCLDDFANLSAFTERFEKLEPIKKFMSSDRYYAKPLNNKMAKFGGDA